jgi:Fe-S-cluster containining protein
VPAASFQIRRQPLRFDCTLCTDCCTLYIPLIVTEDVRRLIHHTGLKASDFVRFYSPAEVDMPANDRTWLRTREGKRALGLRKMKGGACYFLEGPFCRVNEVKPLLCRMYPFQPVNASSPGPTFFRFPKNEKCPAGRETKVPIRPLRLLYRAYSDTTWAYEDEVAAFNRETGGRARARDFLRFAGLA